MIMQIVVLVWGLCIVNESSMLFSTTCWFAFHPKERSQSYYWSFHDDTEQIACFSGYNASDIVF